MFRLKISASLCYVFWMQFGKRIRLEQHFGLLYTGLQIQRRVHLWLCQGKTINSENNTRRFEQFTRSVRSIQSSMVDTYKKLKFNRRNWCSRNRIRINCPGRLTGLLETLFGSGSKLQLHVLNYVFRRIYLKTKEWPNNTYVFRNETVYSKGHHYLDI